MHLFTVTLKRQQRRESRGRNMDVKSLGIEIETSRLKAVDENQLPCLRGKNSL